MKRKKIGKAVAGLMAMALIVMFAGCPTGDSDDNPPAKSSAKALTKITVGSADFTSIPTPISKAEWDSEATLADSQKGIITLADTAALNVNNITAVVSPKAKAAFGTGSYGDTIAFNMTFPHQFSAFDFLFVRVTAENGSVQYYQFQIMTVGGDATLSSLTIADLTASLGSGGDAWNNITTNGVVQLTNATKTNATVDATPADSTTDNDGKEVVIKYAKVTGTGAPTFGDTASFTFVDGDFLYIEVTAKDGTTKRYYKVEIWIGRNADLAKIAFGDQDVDSIGNGGNTLAEAKSGSNYGFISFTTKQPAGGFAVTIEAEDTEATFTYTTGDTNVVDTAITTSYTGTPNIPVGDEEFLYIKVTSASGNVFKYYVIRVTHRQVAVIKAGSPVIKASSEKYIDPLWNDPDLDTYNIAKICPFGDSTEDYKTQGVNHPGYTTAVAKALWDYDGMYIYVDVTDPEVSYKGGAWTTSNAHEEDSFELFINEDLSQLTAVPGTQAQFERASGQYRVGASGNLSGHATNALSAFQTLNKASAWEKEDGNGYIIIMQAPWLHNTAAGWPAETGKEIGFELQINACKPDSDSSTRDGVMVWNNIAYSNYQTNANFGEATLTGTPVVNAQYPTITAQPVGNLYEPGQTAAALTVTASVDDGGDLTYEWFKATSTTDTGTSVASTETYVPDTTTAGTSYYYVVVTNTNNSVEGEKVRSTKSNYVSIIVMSYVAPTNWEERIIMNWNSVPVYGFNLPANKTFGDYDKITLKLRIDSESPKKNGRVRAWGNFNMSDWTNEARGPNMGNDATTGKLLNTANGNVDYTTAVDNWLEVTIAFGNRDNLSSAADIKAASGIVLLGFGLFTNNDGGVGDRIYYLKDIVLSNTDDSESIPAMYPEHPRLWEGKLPGAYVHDGNENTRGGTRQICWQDKVTTRNTNAPVYGFPLPANGKFGFYDRIVFKAKADTSDGGSTGGRRRAWGNYDLSTWTNVNSRPNIANAQLATVAPAANGNKLLNVDGNQTIGTDWTVHTITLSEFTAALHSANDGSLRTAVMNANGLIAVAFGFIGGGDASGTTRTYYVKDVKLVPAATIPNPEYDPEAAADDDEYNVEPTIPNPIKVPVWALRPDSPQLWNGQGAGAYVTQDGNDVVTRELSHESFFEVAP